jgi:uncharacterized glyoxalase superfamily protein PhnB
MAECLAFLRVPDIAKTITWYEQLGFVCLGMHQEPGCDLDWAMLDWGGASFMLYPDDRTERAKIKDAGLYFKTDSIVAVIEKLKDHAEIIEITEETEYGRREVVFKDLNGFQVTFSCLPTIGVD